MSAPRIGTVLEIIRNGDKWFYRVRWDDGAETIEPEWKLQKIRG